MSTTTATAHQEKSTGPMVKLITPDKKETVVSLDIIKQSEVIASMLEDVIDSDANAGEVATLFLTTGTYDLLQLIIKYLKLKQEHPGKVYDGQYYGEEETTVVDEDDDDASAGDKKEKTKEEEEEESKAAEEDLKRAIEKDKEYEKDCGLSLFAPWQLKYLEEVKKLDETCRILLESLKFINYLGIKDLCGLFATAIANMIISIGDGKPSAFQIAALFHLPMMKVKDENGNEMEITQEYLDAQLADASKRADAMVKEQNERDVRVRKRKIAKEKVFDAEQYLYNCETVVATKEIKKKVDCCTENDKKFDEAVEAVDKAKEELRAANEYKALVQCHELEDELKEAEKELDDATTDDSKEKEMEEKVCRLKSSLLDAKKVHETYKEPENDSIVVDDPSVASAAAAADDDSHATLNCSPSKKKKISSKKVHGRKFGDAASISGADQEENEKQKSTPLNLGNCSADNYIAVSTAADMAAYNGDDDMSQD